jgi:hypothetical protein
LIGGEVAVKVYLSLFLLRKRDDLLRTGERPEGNLLLICDEKLNKKEYSAILCI